jgi:hypothetical protein
MAKATDLRRIADRYRRLASVPTTGGHREDRLLLVLAEELDREAETFENQAEKPHRLSDR